MKTKIFYDGFEGHVKRSMERNEKRARGEKLKPERIFTFENTEAMLECLTAKRVHLCQTVRKKRLSITALAAELGRNRGSVTRDVNILLKHSMLRLREEVNPGHGIVQIVEPVAERCEMRIEF
jgi:predicted transcriptional regulator